MPSPPVPSFITPTLPCTAVTPAPPRISYRSNQQSHTRRLPPACTLLTRPPTTQFPSQPAPRIESNPVPDHPDWRYAGPPLTRGPLPAVVYFALTADQSLQLDPFNQFVTSLLPNPSQAEIRVFSVTLPFHTSSMADNEAAFFKWADTYRAGGDLVSAFVRKVSNTIDDLVESGYIDPENAFAAGLSRGGMMAAHLASKNPYIRACLGFAPVTVLSDLPEFSNDAVEGDRARGKIRNASLLNDSVLDALVPIPVRFYMGNFDQRVGTRNAFEFTHLLAERAATSGVRSPPHEFIMYCSVGKHGHGTPSDVFEAGADYIVSLLK